MVNFLYVIDKFGLKYFTENTHFLVMKMEKWKFSKNK